MAGKQTLPDWLLDARVAYPGDSETDAAAFPVRLEQGEIRVLESMDGGELAPRIVVVAAADADAGTASVVLTTNELELATSSDLVVVPEETGLPYPVLVETDIVSEAWAVQLSTKVGRLSVDTAQRDALLRGDMEQLDAGRRGLPILDRSDSRWAWKESEVRSLQALAAPCVAHLLDTALDDVLIPDPALDSHVALGWDGLKTITRVIDLIDDWHASVERAGGLFETADLDGLAELPAGLGHDASVALGQALQASALFVPEGGGSSGRTELSWNPERTDDRSTSIRFRAALEKCLNAGVQTVHVLTSGASWKTEALATGDCAVVEIGPRRVQVVCQVV